MEPMEVHERIDELQIIDVREPEEWQAGRIEGAEHLPMGEVAEQLDRIDPDTEAVMVCRSGARSGEVAKFLRRRGYDAENMEGGMEAWDDADLPYTAPDGSPGEVA